MQVEFNELIPLLKLLFNSCVLFYFCSGLVIGIGFSVFMNFITGSIADFMNRHRNK